MKLQITKQITIISGNYTGEFLGDCIIFNNITNNVPPEDLFNYVEMIKSLIEKDFKVVVRSNEIGLNSILTAFIKRHHWSCQIVF